jgi:hypothetical protein
MTAIVVLGMHRSGTSLVAGALHKMGVYMGSRFREPDETSPYGYWEDLDWRDVNRSILSHANGTWYLPPELSELAYQVILHRNLVSDLAANRGEHDLWGVKDPRTALHALYMHPFLPAPRYVIVHRSVPDTVRSLMRRAKARGYYEPPEHWRWLSNLYLDRITQFIRLAQPQFIMLRFEDLVHPDTAVRSVQALAGYVGVDSEHAIDSAVASIVTREPANE